MKQCFRVTEQTLTLERRWNIDPVRLWFRNYGEDDKITFKKQEHQTLWSGYPASRLRERFWVSEIVTPEILGIDCMVQGKVS